MNYNLKDLIKSAKEKILTDSNFDLNYGYVEAIYYTFGPYYEKFVPGKDKMSLAHQGRAWLSLLTAEKVAHFWQDELKNENIAKNIRELEEEYYEIDLLPKILKASRKYLENDFDLEEYKHLTYDYFWLADYCGLVSYSAGLAMNCLSSTFRIIENDCHLAPEGEEIDLTRIGSDDPNNMDPASLAALIYEGEERKKFWFWWLDEAIGETKGLAERYS